MYHLNLIYQKDLNPDNEKNIPHYWKHKEEEGSIKKPFFRREKRKSSCLMASVSDIYYFRTFLKKIKVRVIGTVFIY